MKIFNEENIQDSLVKQDIKEVRTIYFIEKSCYHAEGVGTSQSNRSVGLPVCRSVRRTAPLMEVIPPPKNKANP
jgi:hypothetical protein